MHFLTTPSGSSLEDLKRVTIRGSSETEDSILQKTNGNQTEEQIQKQIQILSQISFLFVKQAGLVIQYIRVTWFRERVVIEFKCVTALPKVVCHEPKLVESTWYCSVGRPVVPCEAQRLRQKSIPEKQSLNEIRQSNTNQ